MGTNVHSSKKAGILPVAKNHLNLKFLPLDLRKIFRFQVRNQKYVIKLEIRNM